MLFQQTEADLVRLARAGDRVAFADLLRPEYRTAVRLAYGILQDVNEAEDAVQEAALKAWKKIANLHEGSSLRPWFLAIVANQCRTVKRSKWWSVIKDDLPDTEAPAMDLGASIDLRRTLRRIGHDERLVLVLRYYLDMPIDDIATTLGITPKAARSRVDRAIHRLRPIVRMQGAAW